MKKIDPALAAALAAYKGPITRVETGANSGISDKAFYLASKGEISLKAKSDNELIDERHVRGDMVFNGLGEAIAHEPEFNEALWTARMAGDLSE